MADGIVGQRGNEPLGLVVNTVCSAAQVPDRCPFDRRISSVEPGRPGNALKRRLWLRQGVEGPAPLGDQAVSYTHLLETDRREIGRRISLIREELDSVRAHRERHRSKRQQTELQVVAIVGYTNAGKSTLLNRLSGADIYAADQLFATLDPTTRKVNMPGGREVLFTDTVGFIQKLPTQIVAAFRATLEEIGEADILLHVVDVTHPNVLEQMEAVEDTLAELEVDHLPMVVALNKADALQDRSVLDDLHLPVPAAVVSARTGKGIEELLTLIEATMVGLLQPVRVHIPYDRGDLLSLFYERGQVDGEQHTDSGVTLHGRLPARLLPTFEPYTHH